MTLFAVLLVFVWSQLQVVVSGPATVDRRGLAAVVQGALDRGDIPGVALSIVDRSSVLVETGFGVTNVTSGRPMNADTMLPLGSTTKAFTSALLALLIDKHAKDGRRSFYYCFFFKFLFKMSLCI